MNDFQRSNKPYELAYEYLKSKTETKVQTETRTREQMKEELRKDFAKKQDHYLRTVTDEYNLITNCHVQRNNNCTSVPTNALAFTTRK